MLTEPNPFQLIRKSYSALQAMMTEFRAADLPYGSKAYTKANEVAHELDRAINDYRNPAHPFCNNCSRSTDAGTPSDSCAPLCDENGWYWLPLTLQSKQNRPGLPLALHLGDFTVKIGREFALDLETKTLTCPANITIDQLRLFLVTELQPKESTPCK